MNNPAPNEGPWALAAAVAAFLAILAALRIGGAFVAGHTIHACRWLFHRPRHRRRPR